jgi:hypothetical protein
MRALTGSVCVLLLWGCQSKPKEEVEGADEKPVKEKPGEVAEPSEGLAFLMTMTWDEAKVLSAQSLEVPPFFRVAADEIEVLKAGSDGTPRRVRAKGKVFIEMEFSESGRVLCQEAYIADDELILRGKPLLQRGGSAVEGMDDVTVFYMLGTRLRVIGRHRVTNENVLMAETRKAEEVQRGRKSQGFETPGEPPMLPMMRGPWGGGPNPLLPPLSSSSVPEDIRQKMRAEADAVNVLPLDLPGEAVMGPPLPAGTAPQATTPKEPVPAKEQAPLLPVPVKPEG